MSPIPLFPTICQPYSLHFQLTLRRLRAQPRQRRMLNLDHLGMCLLSLRRAGAYCLDVHIALCQPESIKACPSRKVRRTLFETGVLGRHIQVRGDFQLVVPPW